MVLQKAGLDSESGEASPSIGNAKGAGVLYSIQPNVEISVDTLKRSLETMQFWGFCSGLHIHSRYSVIAGIFEETREERWEHKSGDVSSGANLLDDADFTPNPDRAIWMNGEIK